MSFEHIHALPKGVRLNQYEMVSVLGAGGFGITYLAHDTSLDTTVAIKEYLPGDFAVRQGDTTVSAKSSATQGDFDWGLRRFLDEARVLAKFRHPHIVRANQVFEANNTAYLVMEYAKGPSLDDVLKRQGRLNEQQTKEIIFPILDGLKRVHELGFLHRDIKPGNIILREEGGPVLIDFGAARQAIETKTRAITAIVTEGYAPLEQYDPSGNQGTWTDIYAIGGVAYKCLTGNKPPAATSRVRNDPLVPPEIATNGEVSKPFAAAIEAALRVFETDRPQTIDAFITLVFSTTRASTPPVLDATRTMEMGATRALTGTPSAPLAAPVSVSAPTPAPIGMQAASAQIHPQGERRSGIPVLAGAATALILVLAAGGWFAWQNFRPPQPAVAQADRTNPPAGAPPSRATAPPALSAPPPTATPAPSAAPETIAPSPQPSAAPQPVAPATSAQLAPKPSQQASVRSTPPRAAPAPATGSKPTAPAPVTFKPSFDCATATNAAQRLVCSDQELAALDQRMADLYQLGLTHVADTNEFFGEQRSWLTEQRDACTDKACLLTAYNARIEDLKRWAGE
jgi:uncharacterized protein YecT (DUF1311 family)/predicted Ser/Thr protein kinase